MGLFIAGLITGTVVTLVALGALGIAVDRGQRKRAEAARRREQAGVIMELDGVDITHLLERENRNGGRL